MKSIVPFAVLFTIAFAFAIGCVKPPEYPIEPVIEFMTMTKDTLDRGIDIDSLSVTLSFTDGDGDLGSANQENNLFYTDDRDGLPLPGQIPFVPEQGASNGIKGEISFKVSSSCCIFPDSLLSTNFCEDIFEEFPYDVINYTVYILDRAGHKSNEIMLPPIYIRCYN